MAHVMDVDNSGARTFKGGHAGRLLYNYCLSFTSTFFKPSNHSPAVASIYYSSGFRDHAFVWALMLSLGLHVLVALRLPNIQFAKPVIPQILTVELAAPPKPEAVIAPEPAPAPPAPTPQLSKPKPSPALKQQRVPVQETEPLPRSAPEPAIEPSTPPAVITAAPKPATPPVITAPPPEPPKPATPNQSDIDAARNLYGNLLAREIAKHKQYPRIAQMRGWQGEAKVELQIDASGNALASKIQESSGYEILDKQALDMVKKAAPFPTPPDTLRGRTFSILVPVSFHLE